MLVADGITLGIHPADGKAVSSGSVSIGFFIDKIEDAKALLDQHKIAYKAEDDSKSGLYVHFTDLDGNDFGKI